ncbi:MAG: hypothetical protein JOZ80_14815 [Acidobacteriaceae bacterium]|nr:hypothetical protein [Acidobacteriaceae bacterium]
MSGRCIGYVSWISACAGHHHLRCLDLEPVVTRFAHSHSASQFLPHLPSHWYSHILPPHWGQTRLMIDEMMFEVDSHGSTLKVIFAPYSEI